MAPQREYPDGPVEAQRAIAQTRAWVERAVIGLNLCPFAKAPSARGQIRYAVSEAKDAHELGQSLVGELALLNESEPLVLETTLLIHPYVLSDFDEFNQFLDTADTLLVANDLEGVIQIASFHPHYCFAGSPAHDLANATNRSPYPMLHLLRESSVSRAVSAIPDTDTITAANIRTLNALGVAGWAAMMHECGEAMAPRVVARPDDATRG